MLAKDLQKLTKSLEALLFVYGKPIKLSKVKKILKIDSETLNQAIFNLEQNLEKNSGLCLLKNNDQLQLITRSEFSSLIQKILKQEIRENLSPAALETLSIIAYHPNLTKAEIDYVRGVNCAYILRNLLIRGLIEKFPNSKNTYSYKVSTNLLKYLGIKSVKDLPNYQHYFQLINDFVKHEK